MTTHEKQDFIGISLWITSDQLSPETITQKVGIAPTHVRIRGTPTKTGVMRQPQFDLNEWELGERLRAEQNDYIGNHSERFFTDFLRKLKPLVPKIMHLSEFVSVSIGIVYSVREMPYIGLTREQVQVIAALGARVDHEIILYAGVSNSEEEI